MLIFPNPLSPRWNTCVGLSQDFMTSVPGFADKTWLDRNALYSFLPLLFGARDGSIRQWKSSLSDHVSGDSAHSHTPHDAG